MDIFLDILLNRRQFIKRLGMLSSSTIIASFLPKIGIKPVFSQSTPVSNLFISKNGTPVTNMQKVIEMAGGIENFVDQDDVVVLKPNLQWPNQGYTHTQATKALIDIILDRPGGFDGEIIVAENVHGSMGQSGWQTEGSARTNNWADMNYNELISWYQNNAHPNVTAAKLRDVGIWSYITGPSGGYGFVPKNYTISNSPRANGNTMRLSYPVIKSSYSGKLIDTGKDKGAWEGGVYTGQKVKLIFLPTLNNHGTGGEDYAGVTSAVKCHIGFTLENMSVWHTPAYDIGVPRAVGEGVGHLITEMIKPTLYITVAEYSGWCGRTCEEAAQTRTIGLCSNPVALDYWMGKNILSTFFEDPWGDWYDSFLNPSRDNNFRKTLEGCQAMGVGTLDEAQLSVTLYDFNNPQTTRGDIEKKIKQFKEGTATETEVKELINHYMKGQ